MTFNEMTELRVGDRFYEIEYGMGLKCEVIEDPVVEICELDGNRQVRWLAKVVGKDREVNYLATEGLLHYGPKVYFENPYVGIRVVGEDGN